MQLYKKVLLSFILFFIICVFSYTTSHKESIVFTNKAVPLLTSYIKTYGAPLSKQQQHMVAKEIVLVARTTKIPFEMLVAIVMQESNFNPRAISPIGAIGLGQINANIWLGILKKQDIVSNKKQLFHVRNNLESLVYIFEHYLNIANGNVKEALARYNGLNTNFTNIYVDTTIDKYYKFKDFIASSR